MTICERLDIGITKIEISGAMNENEYVTVTETRQPEPLYGVPVLLQPVFPPAQVVVTVNLLAVMPGDCAST